LDLYQSMLRPILFRIDAERAHELGKTVLRRRRLWTALAGRYHVADPRLRTELAGLTLANPVGLAAGLDKDSEMLDAFQALGFGYAIPGSIRGQQAADNPSPKILRYVDRRSLINCTGFPSRGAAYSAPRLAAFRKRRSTLTVVPNITGFTVEEYLRVLEAVQPHADAIEISLSCPNEKYDEHDFLYPETFKRLMGALNDRKRVPFFLKIRNHNSAEERENRFRLIELAVEFGLDAVMLPGARIAAEPRLSLGRGNLGGRDAFPSTLENIRDVHAITRGRTQIKALGGIFSAEDAYDAIAAGASAVELLTGLIYEGWAIASRINRGLLRLMDQRGVADVRALVGSADRMPAPVSPRVVARAVAG
jgi:dihydroorotate dehydrogenase